MSADTTSVIYTPETLSDIPSDNRPYCVIGHPIVKSMSRIFQNAAFRHLNIPSQYYALDVAPEQLADTVSMLKKMDFGGFNITMPHKTAVIPFLDAVEGPAKLISAVNTVHNRDGRLIGYNTDAEGWVRAVREEFSADVRDLQIMILGAGGAGRALAFQAALEKCPRLVLVNRTHQKAVELVRELAPHFKDDRLEGARPRLQALPWDEELIREELQNIDLLVNATSFGFKAEDPSPLPARVLWPHLLVYDIVYHKNSTRLVEAAQQVGARAAHGLSMLLHQGALAFTIWTGQSAPLEIMRRSLLDAP
jgi:shikimate dehydrogenase